MRSARDDRDAKGAAFAGQVVTAFGRGGDGRDAHDVGPAVFGDPGPQVEALPALDEHPRGPARPAVHQAGQDETAQPWQGEAGEDVDVRRRRFDKQHGVVHRLKIR